MLFNNPLQRTGNFASRKKEKYLSSWSDDLFGGPIILTQTSNNTVGRSM
jgi:hypothetical protein